MAESTLGIDYNTLRREVGRFLAWSPEPGEWDADQTRACEDIVAAGYRAFLYPSVPGQIKRHTWSFLRPKAILTTTVGVADYQLPDDVGALVGSLTYESADNAWRTVEITTVQNIRALRQNTATDQQGIPARGAVESLPPDANGSTRLRLLLWPEPDASYTLTYDYLAQPNNLSETNPRPYGNAQHANCLIAAVLAAAEERFNDNQNARRMRFLDELAQAIAQDRVHAPDTLGYNGDGSEDSFERWRYRRGFTVTYSP